MRRLVVGLSAVAVALIAVALIGLPLRRNSGARTQEVHILLFGSTPLLKSVAEAIQQELGRVPAGSSSSYRVIMHDAGFQPINASAQAKIIFARKPAAVVALGTPSIKAALSFRTDDVPFFFGATSDPVGLGLASASDPSVWRTPSSLRGPPATYALVSDFDFQAMVDLITAVCESVGKKSPLTVGYPINDAESNSVLAANELQRLLRDSGSRLERAAVHEPMYVATATRSLIAKHVDAIQIGPDNTVVGGLGGLMAAVGDRKIPVLTSERESVRKGAFGGVGIDFAELGRDLGRRIRQVLARSAPDPPIQLFSQMKLYINKERAGALLPPDGLHVLSDQFSRRGIPLELLTDSSLDSK